MNIILVKLDANYIPQWNRTWGGSNREDCFGLAIDSDNNIYVAGRTESFGAGDEDFFLLKYDSSGHQHWNRTWGGIEFDRCYGLAVDSHNDIYLAGISDTFGRNGALVKFDGSGNQLWNRTFIGGDMWFNAIAIDLYDNIYCVGGYWDVISWDCGLVKYNKSGDQKWYRSWGGNDYDENHGVIIDLAGNINVVGRTRDSPSEEYDICVFKYDDLGTFLWNNTWGGSGWDGWEFPREIEADMSGNVYVVGSTNSSGAITFLVKFDSLGKETWNFTWSDRSYFSMILDFEDRFYLGGSLMGDMLLSKYRYGYFNILNVEIVDQIFSEAAFNITFYIYSILEVIGGYNILDIDNAEIQMWWDGTEVSTDVQDLGGGLYFVSLEPITVLPGEDPILLDMIVSIPGYEDKYFESFIAVDPDTIDKSEPEPEPEPRIPGYNIFILFGVIGISIFICLKKKNENNS